MKRGCTWQEGLDLDAADSGDAGAPLTIADYGDGTLPKLDPSQDAAIEVLNTDDFTLRNLDLANHDYIPRNVDSDGKDAGGGTPGMKAVVDVRAEGAGQSCGEPCTMHRLRLENLVVHHAEAADGATRGIFLQADKYNADLNTYGYIDDIIVDNVESYGNHSAGLETTGTFTKDPTYRVSNIRMLNSYFHENGGDGAVLGMVDNGLVEGNEAEHNGILRTARLGLWTWESKNVTF